MEFRQAFDPFRALSASWRLQLRAPVTLLLGAILVSFLDSGGPAGWAVSVDEGRWEDVAMVLAPFVAFGCCFALALWLFACRLHVGYAGALQRVMVTGDENFSDLFHDRGLWGTMILARVLKVLAGAFTFLPAVLMVGAPLALARLADAPVELGVAAGALLALLFIPIWLYVVLGLVLVEQVVAIEGRGPSEALRRSWEIARGHRLQLLFFALVVGVFQLLGVCACFVGLYVTSALGYGAWYEAYLRFATQPPPEGMWIDGTRRDPDGSPEPSGGRADDLERPLAPEPGGAPSGEPGAGGPAAP